MKVGENKDKIKNIVAGGRDRFDKLYETPLRSFGNAIQLTGDDRLRVRACDFIAPLPITYYSQQDTSPVAVQAHLGRLPRCLRARIMTKGALPSDQNPTHYQSISQITFF